MLVILQSMPCLLVQMVNEQIGTENMKRRVDLEARRQRKMAKVQKAMWADHAECLRMGYDWTARRAKWESELKELQSMREDHSGHQQAPTQTSRPLSRGKLGSPPTRAMLRNDEMYQQGLSKLDALEEDALPDVDLKPGEEAPAAVMDWFKVGPTVLSGLMHICSSVLTAAHSWPVLQQLLMQFVREFAVTDNHPVATNLPCRCRVQANECNLRVLLSVLIQPQCLQKLLATW